MECCYQILQVCTHKSFSHEAKGEAVCPGVCELLQVAMLKYFFFKGIKLLSVQVMQRGRSCSVLSALPCSCCPVLSVLLCSCGSLLSELLCCCCPFVSALLCSCSSLLSELLCSCSSLLSELLCSCCSFLSVLLSSNSSSCSSSSFMFSSSLPGCIQSCQMAWPHSSASGQSGCTCSSVP